MKILKIKIKNINCLRSEWEIDFQSPPLSEAGLFAITGPTGSGKSTILDAITLALFNKIPRFESDAISKSFIEKSGSVITRNETDSFVEVDYSCSKGTFRSKWSIATNKRGGLRDTDMELVDVSTDKPVISGKKEVPKRNTELIGLSYDQFIKSILLSQGEFARFLKSKKDERGKLLEDITGMTVYREIGRRAYERFKEKNEAIRSKADIIDAEEGQLLPKEKEDELVELIRTINKVIHDRETRQAAVDKAIGVKENIELIENEIRKYHQEEEQINNKLEIFNEKNAERILKHERLLPNINEIKSYFTNHEFLEKLNEDIKKEEVVLVNNKMEENRILNSISKFVRFEVSSHNAIKALTDFGIKVSHHITNKLNADRALTHQKLKISSYLKKSTLSHYKSFEIDNNIDQLNLKVYAELSGVAFKIENLTNQTKVKADKINEQKEALQVRLKAMEDLRAQVKAYGENREKLITKDVDIRKEFESIDTAKPQLEELSTLKKAIALKINGVRSQREKKLREKNLEEDRNLLKPGEPCPLCGSLHHPYIQEYFNNVSELTKELENLENDDRKYDAQIQNIERKINIHSGALEALRKEKIGVEKEMRKQEAEIAACKKKLAIERVGNLHALEIALAELTTTVNAINELEKVTAAKRDLEDFKEAVDELVLRSGEFEKAKAEVELRYTGSNIRGDCDSLSEQARTLKDAIQRSETNINANKERMGNLSEQQSKIEWSLGATLRPFGYLDILESFTDILPDTDFNNLKHQLADLQSNLKRIKALIEGANERKQQLVLNDDASNSKENLMEEGSILLQQIKQDKQNLDDYRVQQRENESRKIRIIRLKEQVDETRQANIKWELLNRYIGDATGKNFSTFAQSLTLKKLIALSNERLRKLNDRYLLDVPFEEEDDDLIIIDTYLGEERRSVKTLSGGETFIVSLALALALSDLASRNVKIESLYIDEGFGSLDPEALDAAISTLEQLQIESNKTIGIISHVDALKERIETQIQLEKNSSGFSKVVIR